VSDVNAATALIERAGPMRHLLDDKPVLSDAEGAMMQMICAHLRKASAVPVIPGRCNRKRSIRYDKVRYKERHLVENAFCRLKEVTAQIIRGMIEQEPAALQLA